MKGHSDPETLSFVNQENQRRFIQQLLADISSEESEAVAFKDALEAVKDAMGNVKRMQEDLSNSLNNVATYLQDFKDEIKEDLQDSMTEFTSAVEDRMAALENLSEPKRKSPYDVLHTGKDDHWCNSFVMVVMILMAFFGLFSMDRITK
jgi:DNA repair exonuclease SbcCD ATPase subunit